MIIEIIYLYFQVMSQGNADVGRSIASARVFAQPLMQAALRRWASRKGRESGKVGRVEKLEKVGKASVITPRLGVLDGIFPSKIC